jgi:hypothetical protein
MGGTYEKNTIQESTSHDKGNVYTKVDQKDVLWKRNEEFMRKHRRHVSTFRYEGIDREDGNKFSGKDFRGMKRRISESHYKYVQGRKEAVGDVVSKYGDNFEERGITDKIASLADANNYPGKRQVEIQKEHMRGERFYGVSSGTHDVTQLYDDDDQTSSYTTRPETSHFDAKGELIKHEDAIKDLYVDKTHISQTNETTYLHNKKPVISKISATLLDHKHGPGNPIEVSRYYHHYTQEITNDIGDDGKEFTYKPDGAEINLKDDSYRYRKNNKNTHSSTSLEKDHERSHSSTSSRKDHEKTHSSTSLEKDHEKPHSSTSTSMRRPEHTKYIRRRISPEEYEEREKDVSSKFTTYEDHEKGQEPELNTVKMTPNYQRTVENTIPNYFSSSNEKKISSNEDAIKSVSSEVETGLDNLHLNDL